MLPRSPSGPAGALAWSQQMICGTDVWRNEHMFLESAYESMCSTINITSGCARMCVILFRVMTLVNTVRPDFESQQWPQAGCASDALHPS